MKTALTAYKKQIFVAVIIMIFGVFLFSRLFRLDFTPFGPHGMHIDELGAAYDSFCISEYGVDQYQYKLPVYFRCFGEGQNALYTYLAAVIFKLGGVSVFNFRLVAVICAVFAFIAMFFLSGMLVDRKYIPLALFLMTSMPAYVMSEHWGLECYLFLSFAIISMSFMLGGLLKQSVLLYFLSGLFWGITLYTYAITYVVVPPFLVLALIYLIRVRKIDIRQALATALPVCILGTPLFIQQLVMMDVIPPFEAFGIIDFWRPVFYRYGAISPSFIPYNLLHSTYLILVDDLIEYNSAKLFGSIYYVSIPFMLIGLVLAAKAFVISVKTRKEDPWALVFIFYVTARIALLFVKEPNTNRANSLYLPFLLFTVYGIIWAVEKINKRVFTLALAAAYMVSFLCFSYWMYSYSGYRQASDVTGGMKVDVQAGEVLAYAKKIADGKDIAAIINEGWCTDLTIALFTETSPFDYSNDNDETNDRYNGITWGVPTELDLSGETIFVIDNDLHHITDYLVSEGFAADYSYEGYAVVARVI